MSTSQTFIAHLIELRSRLLRSMVALLVVFLCLFPWASDLYALLAQPLLAKLPQGGQMIATDVTTPFFVPLKVALMASFLIALPYILYQIWCFIAPGLYEHEKRWIVPMVVTSLLLFFCGMANLLLASAWWLAHLVARYTGAPIFALDLAIAPIWAHSFFMLFTVFPTFIFGFLFTTFPRWMNGPPVTRRAYAAAGAEMLRRWRERQELFSWERTAGAYLELLAALAGDGASRRP